MFTFCDANPKLKFNLSSGQVNGQALQRTHCRKIAQLCVIKRKHMRVHLKYWENKDLKVK
jgi:hypothetical protein